MENFGKHFEWKQLHGGIATADFFIHNRWRLVDHPDNDPEGVRMIEEAQRQ